MKKIILFLILTLAFVSCSSLENNSYSDSTNSSTDSGILKEWTASGSTLTFHSSENKNSGETFKVYGKTIEEPIKSQSLEIIKTKGSLTSGYGIVFGLKDDKNFYSLLINSNGQFTVKKTIKGKSSILVDWTKSSNLKKGLGSANKLGFTYSENTKMFSIYINGKKQSTFVDYTFLTGKRGVIVEVGENESTDNLPVEITYKKLQ